MEKNLKEKFETGVQYLPGVGPKSAKKFAKLGVETIGDLLWYFPRKYLDYSNCISIAEAINQKIKIQNPKYGKDSSDIKGSLHSVNTTVGMTASESLIGHAGDEAVTIRAMIVGIGNKKTRRRGFTVTEAMVEDGTGTIKIVWFNQPYLIKTLRAGREIILHGKVNWDFFNKTYVMESPDWADKPKIVPIYKETNGVSSYYIGKIVSHVAKMISEVDDFLPQQIIKENNLLTLDEAIRILHTPKDMNELDKARERMAFDELFLISLRGQVLKAEIQRDIAPVIDVEDGKIDEFISQLPYKLTGDQKKAVEEIIADISAEDTRYKIPACRQAWQDTKKHQTQKQEGDSSSLPAGTAVPQNDYKIVYRVPMNRLLNGDVGSGKTVVAAIASYAVVKAGYKVMLMAPTEILAKQHYNSFAKLFEKFDVNVELITSSTKNQRSKIPISPAGRKNQNVNKENNNEDPSTSLLFAQDDTIIGRKPILDIMIGTHALLHLKEPVGNVGLVIVDEQHRFGVSQRQALRGYQKSKIPASPAGRKNQNDGMETSLEKNIANNSVPHFLSMTATPIPRTLQLALFAELDVSIIKEKPANRKEIKTRVVDEIHRQKAYEFIRAHVKAGRQVFVICPLIEEKKTEETSTELFHRRDTEKNINFAKELFELDRKTVVGEYEKLSKNVFPDLRIGMLHGKMPALPREGKRGLAEGGKSKQEVMAEFSSGELDILVSTSVVEVGVDVPNASIMMIEDTERFGLAQLHQFRGRVGRGEHQSFCFLFSNSQNEKTIERIKRMETVADGFKLAEFDLKNRGAGDIFGLEQSGFMDIKFADLSNIELISKATNAAKKLIGADEKLTNHTGIKQKLGEYMSSKHME